LSKSGLVFVKIWAGYSQYLGWIFPVSGLYSRYLDFKSQPMDFKSQPMGFKSQPIGFKSQPMGFQMEIPTDEV